MRDRSLLAIAWCLLLVLVACDVRPHLNSFPLGGEALLADFRSDRPPTIGAYDDLFFYFVLGFESFRSSTGSMSVFPGLPSRHGATADGMEGFARLAPMWGAWRASGRPNVITLPGPQTVDIDNTFKQGILSGTNPTSPGYWGNIANFDQRVVEASDIALSLWLFRDSVWRRFSPAEKKQVSDWLYQVNGKRIPDNNWHLFITFVNVVLDKLGCPSDRTLARQHYQRTKQFYRGDGWFSDGPDNTFDYYNAWGIHYQLYWLQQVAPDWDTDFISIARRQFVASYQYLVSVTGVPMLGRSVCYRTAAVAPLVFGSENDQGVTPGVGRRALDVTWNYFIRNGALRNGNITQGYCGPDARILDNYSGPASCLWGLRSLIVAFYKPPDSPFWRDAVGALPVETKDFAFTIAPIQWHVIGTRSSGAVEIDIPSNNNHYIALEPYGWWRQLATAFLWRPFRPDNTEAKYRSTKYESSHPFCGCLN
jgi:hypothetical protein